MSNEVNTLSAIPTEAAHLQMSQQKITLERSARSEVGFQHEHVTTM